MLGISTRRLGPWGRALPDRKRSDAVGRNSITGDCTLTHVLHYTFFLLIVVAPRCAGKRALPRGRAGARTRASSTRRRLAGQHLLGWELEYFLPHYGVFTILVGINCVFFIYVIDRTELGYLPIASPFFYEEDFITPHEKPEF